MQDLIFPEPDPDKLRSKILDLPIYGRSLRTTRNFACVMCGRSILPLGRLAWHGAPLCRHQGCELTPVSKITQIFVTPYGRAIHQGILRIFCRTLEKDRVLVQRQPIIERIDYLVDGYIDLLKWQRTYHDYDRLKNPDTYEEGAITLVPPRRMDEVLVFRTNGMPVKIKPTRNLPQDQALLLRRIYKIGPKALTVPF